MQLFCETLDTLTEQLLQSGSPSFVGRQTNKSKDQAPKQRHYFSRIGPEIGPHKWDARLTQVAFSQRYLQSHMWSSIIYIFISGGGRKFIYKKWWSPIASIKTCGDALFYSFFSYLASMRYLESSFKQKRIYLFWVNCFFSSHFWLTKVFQEIQA